MSQSFDLLNLDFLNYMVEFKDWNIKVCNNVRIITWGKEWKSFCQEPSIMECFWLGFKVLTPGGWLLQREGSVFRQAGFPRYNNEWMRYSTFRHFLKLKSEQTFKLKVGSPLEAYECRYRLKKI